MTIYCLEDFKLEFEKLQSKNSYKSIEKDIIKYFFNKKIEELKSGTLLNQSHTTPYIKKRINGSGGYRFYYLLIIKDENLYLLFVHPKTGVYGAPNINDESKAFLYKKVLTAIKEKTVYHVILNTEKSKLIFENQNNS